MATMLEMADEIKARETKRRRALSLKNLIPDVESAEATAMRLDLIGKGIDVRDMVMNGIEAAQRVQEAVSIARRSDLVRYVYHDSELGLTTLKESAEITKLSQEMKVGDSVMAAERFMFAFEVFGVLTTYISVWIDLAGAWAAAKADILADNSASGVSRGVVLGANDCGPHYVSEFWMFGKPSYPGYREVEASARNLYNIGLVAGYGAGKELSRNQKGNLFGYIHSNLSNASQRIYSGNFKDWSPGKKKDYYIDCGASFRSSVIDS
jgi:hypothetical protein